MPPEDRRPTLYSPALLARSRAPTHTEPIASPTHTVRVNNPLCGDRVNLEARIEDGVVQAIRHKTRGCALCVASASVVCEAAEGHPTDGLRDRAAAVLLALSPTAPDDAPLSDPALTLFRAVASAPARRGCVALPWTAISKILP